MREEHRTITSVTSSPLATPVVFAFFNRPDRTALTFDRIAAVRPAQLFLIADGPRPNHPTDAAMCAETRALVESILAERVDWACEVYRNYADENMGLRRRFSTGLNWVFDQVDRAIIIEDDILAETSFFYFAQEMLERYRDDQRVMHVGGYNPVGWYHPEASSERLRATYPYSYYFTAYASIWGWATWRRAWQPYYDVDLKLWTPVLEAELAKDPGLSQSRVQAYAVTHRGMNTWDYQWSVACWLQSGLGVVPAQNTIRNIGFGDGATNTNDTLSRHASVTSAQLEFPLIHPPWMMTWPSYERAAQRVLNGTPWRNAVIRWTPKGVFDLARKLLRLVEKVVRR